MGAEAGRERDNHSFLNEIVTLADFNGKLASWSRRTGCVRGYDKSRGMYHILMERNISIFARREQILEVMLHGDRDVKVAMDTCKQYPLEGIPDNGIEFTLLHEIVSQKARLRLER